MHERMSAIHPQGHAEGSLELGGAVTPLAALALAVLMGMV
jgi:hypothetical protein